MATSLYHSRVFYPYFAKMPNLSAWRSIPRQKEAENSTPTSNIVRNPQSIGHCSSSFSQASHAAFWPGASSRHYHCWLCSRHRPHFCRWRYPHPRPIPCFSLMCCSAHLVLEPSSRDHCLRHFDRRQPPPRQAARGYTPGSQALDTHAELLTRLVCSP